MKQTILRKLMLIAVLLTSSHAFAQDTYPDFDKDGIYYRILSEEKRTVMVSSPWYYNFPGNEYVNEYSGSVVIPEKLIYGGKTYTVTAIEAGAFYRSKNLTSVTIPNSVTSIGYGAFGYCGRLSSITISNSVTSIGKSAFSGCEGLARVNISDLDAWCNIDFGDFYSNPLYQADNLYLNNEKVTSLVIPNTITEIKKYAFYYCDGLTSVTIPNSVTSIGESAFYYCRGLTSVTIGDSVTSIGKNAFENCSGLISVTIPNSVTSIGESAFYYCRGLTSVTIGDSVTSIGDYTFYGCSSLTSVTIPNSVASIGKSAFENCSGLISVTIPNSVTSIGDYAFWNCDGLIGVNISDLDAWCNIDFGGWDSNPLSIAHNLYLNNEKVTSLVIPNTITEIKKRTFAGCKGLTSVTIPNSVTSIGDYAFYGCTGLTSVTIPNSVTSIGNGAFSGCTGLTSVTIPNSVTSIGYGAFSGCTGLTSVTIPNSVTSIGVWVFDDCSGLTEIYCKATNPPTWDTKYQTFSDEILQYVTLYVPTGCKSAYESVDPWRNFWNIEEYEFSGVESTLVDDVNILVENGNLIVNGADNAKVEVYSVNGQCVYNGNATTIPVTIKGIYIVKVNDKSFKVIL